MTPGPGRRDESESPGSPGGGGPTRSHGQPGGPGQPEAPGWRQSPRRPVTVTAIHWHAEPGSCDGDPPAARRRALSLRPPGPGRGPAALSLPGVTLPGQARWLVAAGPGHGQLARIRVCCCCGWPVRVAASESGPSVPESGRSLMPVLAQLLTPAAPAPRLLQVRRPGRLRADSESAGSQRPGPGIQAQCGWPGPGAQAPPTLNTAWAGDQLDLKQLWTKRNAGQSCRVYKQVYTLQENTPVQ